MMQAEKHKWLKPLLAFIFYGDILALVLTYSRGGFLGGITVGLYMLMIAKRKILACFFGFVLLASVVNYFIPQPYWERMETLKKPEGEEAYEGSAQARIMVWRSAIEMMKDYPLTGVGFYNSERKIGEYPDPVTGISQPGRAIHNSILKLGSELGFPALFLFIWIFGGSFITLMKIKRNVKRYEIDPSYSYYASMFQAALVGYYSAGLFVNAPFIDISWHLVGLSIALEQIVQREITWKYESTFIPQTKIAVH
jgi:O-antigen ligase